MECDTMPIVVAVWPNNTVSIARMPIGFSATYLFDVLDQVGDPQIAECYVLKSEDGELFANFDWDHATDEIASPKSKNLQLEVHQGRMKRFPWPKTVWRDWFRTIERAARHSQREQSAMALSQEEIADLPVAPTKTHTVEEVRKMRPFSGVYFAFNADGSCHYVGEAKDVTKRVLRSRAEIGDRRIGVIACKASERKRIESYFIGIMNPPGNSQSTHRMSEKSES
jgi:hypothetical protein